MSSDKRNRSVEVISDNTSSDDGDKSDSSVEIIGEKKERGGGSKGKNVLRVAAMRVTASKNPFLYYKRLLQSKLGVGMGSKNAVWFGIWYAWARQTYNGGKLVKAEEIDKLYPPGSEPKDVETFKSLPRGISMDLIQQSLTDKRMQKIVNSTDGDRIYGRELVDKLRAIVNLPADKKKELRIQKRIRRHTANQGGGGDAGDLKAGGGEHKRLSTGHKSKRSGLFAESIRHNPVQTLYFNNIMQSLRGAQAQRDIMYNEFKTDPLYMRSSKIIDFLIQNIAQ